MSRQNLSAIVSTKKQVMILVIDAISTLSLSLMASAVSSSSSLTCKMDTDREVIC